MPVLRYDFRPGDRVRVALTEDHRLQSETDNPAIDHAATFQAYHIADRTWCTVLLDKPHGGGSESRAAEILDVPVSAVTPAPAEEDTPSAP